MRRLITLTTTALVAFAAVSGPVSAMVPREDPQQQTDLRSPDARDSGRQPSVVQTDLRSPDARDVATRPTETYTPGSIVQSTPVVALSPDGFDWGDAGIGAAGGLALLALSAGTVMIVSQRRRNRGYRVATH
jgi:hypothetical protein